MKRSEVNRILAEAEAMLRSHRVVLPPFADWTPEEFRARRQEASAIVAARMGWDVTDYGEGRFEELGLFLFTLRNGDLSDLEAGQGRVYAEKLLITRKNQLSPMHTHLRKVEDIINRGGGNLAIELCGSDADGNHDPDAGGQVMCDGLPRDYGPGEVIRLAPGASVTLRPGDWHAFWAEGADVLVGEVSTVNDDETDNVFREELPRFARIDEDEAPYRLLVSDYGSWLSR